MAAAMAAELYVYYKLRAEQVAAARAAFDGARGGEPVRLLQRHDGDGALLTWMEVYGAELADASALERRIAQALQPFVQGLRQCEVFVAL
jgi:hypothetical protein